MSDKPSAVNDKQIEILELLYKYRFGSRQLLADSLGIKSGTSLYERLNVLINHGLVAMRQEKKSKLLGIPAAYFLTPKGLRVLQSLDGHDYISEAVIKSSYKDKVLSESFVLHALKVYGLTNALKRRYRELKVYLRRDMSRYDYFPDSPPDAFLSLKKDGEAKRSFLDVIPDGLPRNVLDRRLTSYLTFFEDGGWEAMNSELPALLLVAEKGTTETRARRAARAVVGRLESDEDLDIYTTTYTAIENMDRAGEIWTHIDEPDELLSLDSL